MMFMNNRYVLNGEYYRLALWKRYCNYITHWSFLPIEIYGFGIDEDHFRGLLQLLVHNLGNSAYVLGL